MASTTLRLAIPSQLEQVRFASAALRAVLAEAACSPEQVADVELCLVEAINNVIEHAYRERPEGEVQVGVEVTAETLRFEVSDRGLAMPAAVLEAARAALTKRADDSVAIQDLPEGGWGLGLILQLMDEVSYRSISGENVLAMTLRRSPLLPDKER